MLRDLSMCTHRKRVWGLINKSYYVISDKVVFTPVSSLGKRNAHYWARSEFTAVLSQLTRPRYLSEIYRYTTMGDMGLFLLTVALYLIKLLTPKLSKSANSINHSGFSIKKKKANRKQKLPCNHPLIWKKMPPCFSVTRLCSHSKLNVYVVIALTHLARHNSVPTFSTYFYWIFSHARFFFFPILTLFLVVNLQHSFLNGGFSAIHCFKNYRTWNHRIIDV